MNALQRHLHKVEEYLSLQDWSQTPVMRNRQFRVLPLAKGEYNLNYLLRHPEVQLVFRVNIGTQIDRDDQILYEFRALQLLCESGVTPTPYFADNTKEFIEQGILIMEYLPGRDLDYNCDIEGAAGVFACLHQVEADQGSQQLINEAAPLSLILTECKQLLAKYFDSSLASPDIATVLRDILDWADQARHREIYYQESPWPCVVNTEVNSGNFIVNPERRTIHLIDWEMPRWGDPSSDLCHFCSPLTTLWKTDYRMSEREVETFLDQYRNRIRDQHLRDTLKERFRLKMPFVMLRGISWSAMAWAAYQTDYNGIRDPHTWRTLQQYMQLDFIRSLFTPFTRL